MKAVKIVFTWTSLPPSLHLRRVGKESFSSSRAATSL